MKSKKTILCVDDHEQALSIRKLMLETRGYRVIDCTSGEQALEAFRADPQLESFERRGEINGVVRQCVFGPGRIMGE